MKIKYLLALSFCAVATNYCGDSQQKDLCDQAGTSAVAAGFSAQSGFAQDGKNYDENVDWRTAFQQRSTPLIVLFNQFKEAVKDQHPERALQIFKIINCQFDSMVCIHNHRYLSFLRDYYCSNFPDQAFKFTEDFFQVDKMQRHLKSDCSRFIQSEIYRLGLIGPAEKPGWSLYKERKDGISTEIADILEYLYCVLERNEENMLYDTADEILPNNRKIIRFLETIASAEEILNGEYSDSGIYSFLYSVSHTESIIFGLGSQMVYVQNKLIKKRAEYVLNKMKQRLQKLTKND